MSENPNRCPRCHEDPRTRNQKPYCCETAKNWAEHADQQAKAYAQLGFDRGLGPWGGGDK